MASEPPCHPTVVWGVMSGMNDPRTRGIYLLCEDDPSSPRHSAISDRRTPQDRLCHSYTQLSDWLLTYCFTPRPPDRCSPTANERDEECESIVRLVRPQEMP